MKHVITLIPGDGIGPEVTKAMQEVLQASGVDIEWEVCEAGSEVLNRYGTTLPQETLDSIMKNKIAIKGPIGTPNCCNSSPSCRGWRLLANHI
ncbi:MAG: hypothetical protein KatS3mg068_0639 [Candidatus Sericytochromatia bacterium]|nr:MAG: hypothetical protein KatS3mg068_0639 [Candidatus Sericytochromatia bacterium]